MEDPREHYEKHGWWMWVCWCILGWVMIASKRYTSPKWLIGQVVHSLIAYLIAIATFVDSYKNFNKLHWKVNEINLHLVLAIVVIVMVVVVMVSGVALAVLGRFARVKPWLHHYEIQNYMQKFHRITGRLIVFLGFLTSSSGMMVYSLRFDGEDGVHILP